MSMEEFRRQLESIAADYRRALPKKLDDIDALWRGLASGDSGPAPLVELQRELHTLAGAARTMGVAGVSEAAAAAETFIQPYCERKKLPAAAERHHFEKLLQALRLAIPAP